jgi:1,4-dihydroxy-2-naphthoyl-CoA synthase
MRMSFPDYKADSIRFEIDKDAPIGRMYIDRVSKLNAVTMEMRRDLIDFFEKVDEDSRVRVVVLRGLEARASTPVATFRNSSKCRYRNWPILPIPCPRRSVAPNR